MIRAVSDRRSQILAIAAMAAVVVASNYLVQFPVIGQLGSINLADLLTWGAFTYPAAFLVTDLTNRHLGPAKARQVVLFGFAVAILVSVLLPESISPRIVIASGSAFLVAQLLDVFVFNRLRSRAWWQAPLISSVLGSIVDTGLFFSLAFAASFEGLGANDSFAIEIAPMLGVLALEAPRWMSWALGDLAVKLAVTIALLAPYRFAITLIPSRPQGGAAV